MRAKNTPETPKPLVNNYERHSEACTCGECERPEIFNTVIAGVCMDCGNGTLNNDRLPAFRELYYEATDTSYLVCMNCGHSHLSLVVL